MFMETENEQNSHWKEDPGDPVSPEISGKKQTPEITSDIPPENRLNEKPDTEMEVHHHPQLEHKHKPWKEYLLEGLMIFVAVMMGFIAENVREGITNREHVKELVSQLVRDMKNDTLQLNQDYNGETGILNANDSLVLLLQQPLEKINSQQLQTFIIRSHNLWPFYPSDGAIGAIKNELHLKQFASSRIIELIATYEKHIELLKTVEAITLQYQRSYLDPFLLQHFTTPDLDAAFKENPVAPTQFQNLKPEDMAQMASKMVLVRTNTNELIRDNRILFDNATELLQYVKKEFHPVEE
jgi:hypothetical protein